MKELTPEQIKEAIRESNAAQREVMKDKELLEILASIEGYTGKKLTPLDLTPEETILISPRLSEAKTKLLAWRDKAVQEARIDELKLMYKTFPDYWGDYVQDRIKELQQ